MYVTSAKIVGTVEDVQRISKRRRKVRSVGNPHPWEPRHMHLRGVRFAESMGGARRNVTLGVIQHLWRAPVAFVGFYVPEGVQVTQNRMYVPSAPKLVDDSEYLLGVEAHKQAFAMDLQESMLSAGNLPGYFEIPVDEGWQVVLDLVNRKLELCDAWGASSEARVLGDLAPFVWAYRHSGFCIFTIYDKDLNGLRDDLLFVAKRGGVELRWGRRAA